MLVQLMLQSFVPVPIGSSVDMLIWVCLKAG